MLPPLKVHFYPLFSIRAVHPATEPYVIRVFRRWGNPRGLDMQTQCLWNGVSLCFIHAYDIKGVNTDFNTEGVNTRRTTSIHNTFQVCHILHSLLTLFAICYLRVSGLCSGKPFSCYLEWLGLVSPPTWVYGLINITDTIARERQIP